MVEKAILLYKLPVVRVGGYDALVHALGILAMDDLQVAVAQLRLGSPQNVLGEKIVELAGVGVEVEEVAGCPARAFAALRFPFPVERKSFSSRPWRKRNSMSWVSSMGENVPLRNSA